MACLPLRAGAAALFHRLFSPAWLQQRGMFVGKGNVPGFPDPGYCPPAFLTLAHLCSAQPVFSGHTRQKGGQKFIRLKNFTLGRWKPGCEGGSLTGHMPYSFHCALPSVRDLGDKPCRQRVWEGSDLTSTLFHEVKPRTDFIRDKRFLSQGTRPQSRTTVKEPVECGVGLTYPNRLSHQVTCTNSERYARTRIHF